jgi:hypothetical protein
MDLMLDIAPKNKTTAESLRSSPKRELKSHWILWVQAEEEKGNAKEKMRHTIIGVRLKISGTTNLWEPTLTCSSLATTNETEGRSTCWWAIRWRLGPLTNAIAFTRRWWESTSASKTSLHSLQNKTRLARLSRENIPTTWNNKRAYSVGAQHIA